MLDRPKTRVQQIVEFYRLNPNVPDKFCASAIKMRLATLRVHIHRLRTNYGEILPPLQYKKRHHGNQAYKNRNRENIRTQLVTCPGISRKEIADKLDLSLETVSKHIAAIRKEWR